MTDADAPFDQPWQIRVFAMGRALVDGGQVEQAQLQAALAGAIAAHPDRPYWESYLVAVEQLAGNVRS